jgi:hypothetical protein
MAFYARRSRRTPSSWRVIFLRSAFYGSPAEGNWRSLDERARQPRQVQVYMGLLVFLAPIGLYRRGDAKRSSSALSPRP